jgi:hypothetical protein
MGVADKTERAGHERSSQVRASLDARERLAPEDRAARLVVGDVQGVAEDLALAAADSLRRRPRHDQLIVSIN